MTCGNNAFPSYGLMESRGWRFKRSGKTLIGGGSLEKLSSIGLISLKDPLFLRMLRARYIPQRRRTVLHYLMRFAAMLRVKVGVILIPRKPTLPIQYLRIVQTRMLMIGTPLHRGGPVRNQPCYLGKDPTLPQ